MHCICLTISFELVVGTNMRQVQSFHVIMGSRLCGHWGLLDPNKSGWLPSLGFNKPDHRPRADDRTISSGNDVLVCVLGTAQKYTMSSSGIELVSQSLRHKVQECFCKPWQPFIAILTMVPLKTCAIVVPGCVALG